jgi:hypothetical protein
LKKLIASVCAGAALIGGVGSAVAHTTHTPTDVIVDDVEYIPVDTFMMRGHLATTKRCRANRRMKLFIRYLDDQDHWTLVDEGTSTTNGYWIGTGSDEGGVNGWKIRAARKNVGPTGHRHICDADTFQN